MNLTQENIDINETHIMLSTDLKNHNLNQFIKNERKQLEKYIQKYPEFKLSLEKLINPNPENNPEIINLMYKTSKEVKIGPMASVAGTISELSLNHLIKQNTKTSIIENGGDIALINDKKIICGIYSNNEILGNQIGFKLKPNKKPIGICTSSGKIGHSISFGNSEAVTIISNSASLSDGLATKIANEVKGNTNQEAIENALDYSESYKDLFKGALIISGDSIGTIGKLPKLVQTEEFELDKI